ncbi:hypothetical protein BpHYR1_038717 [Brachionus plicatilis]|uniref:Secreted protein n=1 Tax=Brachionus plicatilis TaxID=10195 RepID=A0A3M7SAK1_BRAPC|nr:hypothetical protein BpHYR1_038717 [Brachionus plicatilis]
MLVLAFSLQMMPLLAMDKVCCSITSCNTARAVRPTADEPLPLVYCALGTSLYTYCNSCDLEVPGSPQRRMFTSARVCRPDWLWLC